MHSTASPGVGVPALCCFPAALPGAGLSSAPLLGSDNPVIESDIYSHTQQIPGYIQATRGRTWELSAAGSPGAAVGALPKEHCVTSAALPLLSQAELSAQPRLSGEPGWLMEGIPGVKLLHSLRELGGAGEAVCKMTGKQLRNELVPP